MSNRAFSVKDIQNMVFNVWKMAISYNTIQRLLKERSHEVSFRRCKALSSKRNSEEVLENVSKFIADMENFLSKHQFPKHAIINYDETRIAKVGKVLRVRRVESSSRVRANAESTNGTTIASLLTFVQASGKVLLSVFCLKAKFNE